MEIGSNTAVVGIGATEFSKDSGRSEMQLAAEACRSAMADAGLKPTDIDGMITYGADPNDENRLLVNLGVPKLRIRARTPGGGGGTGATMQLAASAVASGAADAVLVYRAFNERSGGRFGQPQGDRVGARAMSTEMSFSLPFAVDTPAKMYSLWYQRYMHTHGVTNEDFALYSVIARANAATNPAAHFYGRPVTIEDHQSSRWIVEPILRLLDCCQESDGGVALIVTSADRARAMGVPAARILAADQCHLRGGAEYADLYGAERDRYPESKILGEQMYRTAGITADDIDVAMIYENFTPAVFMQIEAFGFCGPGEAKDFLREGHMNLDGKVPINPNGGHFGEAYIHGMNLVCEGVRQARGDAVNQVDGAEIVLVGAGRSGLILGPL